ncbi:hypothetical protein ACT3CE_05090 [Marinifilum sp. RC60d5]
MLILLALAKASANKTEKNSKLNVILVMLDDIGVGGLACNGNQ